MIDPLPIIPVILGPTASGKTSIGIELAALINGEIISVDSRKVYKGIPIGTATPAGHWRAGAYWVKNVAHYLMDFLPLDQPYTAGDFVRDAAERIRDILLREKTPILVGGTGFYFKAFSQGLPALPSSDAGIRSNLETRIEKHGMEPLYDELKQIDPFSAARITRNDRHKIIRALEVFQLTGMPMSSFEKKKQPYTAARFVPMGLEISKSELERRIEHRSEQMVEDGMIEETAAALESGASPTCPALLSFGYKEATQVVLGSLPRSEFLPTLIKGTKAYAKRQRTWFRTQTKPIWFNCETSLNAVDMAMKMKAFCYSKPL